MQRAHPAALLEVQREHEEERRLAAPEHELREQPRADRALREQRRGEQRRAAAAREAPLMQANAARITGASASEIHVHSGQSC